MSSDKQENSNPSSSSSSKSNQSDEIIDIIDSVGVDMGRLCMNEIYSDVEFLVEDQRLPGHRNILAARSEYFRALLYGGMAESKEREIRLEVPLAACKLILGYIYMGTLPLSTLKMDTILDVLALARLYMLQKVETTINTYLCQNLDVGNVCVILEAMRHNSPNQPTEKCLKFMERNMSTLLKHDSIRLLSKKSLEEVLRRQRFNAPEIDVFGALHKWSLHNPTEDIKSMLSLVNLSFMSVDELVHVVRPSGLIKRNEILDAISDVISKGESVPSDTSNVLTSGKYPVRIVTSNQYKLVIDLSSLFLIDFIFVDKSSCECYVDVSSDHYCWHNVGLFEADKNRQALKFRARSARYIRLTSSNGGALNSIYKLTVS